MQCSHALLRPAINSGPGNLSARSASNSSGFSPGSFCFHLNTERTTRPTRASSGIDIQFPNYNLRRLIFFFFTIIRMRLKPWRSSGPAKEALKCPERGTKERLDTKLHRSKEKGGDTDAPGPERPVDGPHLPHPLLLYPPTPSGPAQTITSRCVDPHQPACASPFIPMCALKHDMVPRLRRWMYPIRRYYKKWHSAEGLELWVRQAQEMHQADEMHQAGEIRQLDADHDQASPTNNQKLAEVDISPWTPLLPLPKPLVRELPTDINSTENQLECATDCLSVSSFSSDWMLWDKNGLETQGAKAP